LTWSKAFPKPLTDDIVRAREVVITVGCGDACPVQAGKRYLDWELTDPVGKGVDAVRPADRRTDTPLVVIHEVEATDTAGSRVACLNIPPT
jgi:hypothetical protein